MSEKIIQTVEQLVNRQRTHIPAMSHSELSALLQRISYITDSKETHQRNQRIAQRYALYRCRKALCS